MDFDKKKIVEKILKISFEKNEGHIPSSLSILDILFVLYSKILDVNRIKKNEIDRDKFILSKGHASLAIYSILDEFGLLEENLDNFCDFNSKLGGHPSDKINGIEISSGSLGHGLPIAVGMAIGHKIRNFTSKIYVLVGDGELNEGTNWESFLLGAQHNLDNLVCILDYNKSNDRALHLNNLEEKMNSFGWEVDVIDGHNLIEIEKSLSKKNKKPKFILANTIKGKGCKIMENNPEWHHKFPNLEELKLLIENL
jgi:transketolase